MTQATIYHNPRCSKSRMALALLEERGVTVNIVKYLEGVLTADQVLQLCDQLAVEPIEMMRLKESAFKELGLSSQDQKPREVWAEIIAENPILLERPIVVVGNQAAIGRPTENILPLIEQD